MFIGGIKGLEEDLGWKCGRKTGDIVGGKWTLGKGLVLELNHE